MNAVGCVLRGLSVAVLVVMLVRPGAAKEIEGVQFADTYTAGRHTLRLNCVGLLRYMVFIKGYVAALYLGDGVGAAAALDDVPKRLEIEYFHAITGSDFAAATDVGIAANIGERERTTLQPRIEQLNGLYESVRPGDRYALTYLPGEGTQLTLNGQPKGTIPGADFAAALFAIWIGPQPLDTALKSQLLHCAG